MGTPSTDARRDACEAALEPRGQSHVLKWWDELNGAQRVQLLADIESIPWDVVDPLIDSHVLGAPEHSVPSDLSPPDVYRRDPAPQQRALYDEAERLGRNLIQAGKVAAFTVAGGQGTRLGCDGPKGMVTVTPAGGRTLFALFAEAIKATSQRYATSIPWYIMTSPGNHGQTAEFFQQHQFLGLPESDVTLFSQGTLPAFDFGGRMLMAQKHRLALAPDGHGGSLKALVKSGSLGDARRRGVEIISYFQVDNPLVIPIDPLFIGLHSATGSEMATKVTPKADDLERVGNLCLQAGKLRVIEYSELPSSLAHAGNEDGSRKFDAANLAIHLINVSLIERIIASSFALPYRRAEKKVPYINESGLRVEPDEPNAVKLETFVFDAVTLAKSPLVLEVARAEEFSPVKNLTGIDSLETAWRDQLLRTCRWLESAGVTIPRKPNGDPDVALAISPLFALDAEEVRRKRDRLPTLRAGDVIYIE
ncbi:MAG: UDPGP type 1 family protein [Planctomycetes bacterium]|nr:UDPGP type 1 family protein [Planctomycetota bacterium]